MQLQEAIKIIKDHNEWRKGSDEKPMIEPKELSQAIDLLIEFTENNVDDNSERCFLVFYTGSTVKTNVSGYCCFNSNNGTYLNNSETISGIKSVNADIVSCVVTNIIELNKSDYEMWIAKN